MPLQLTWLEIRKFRNVDAVQKSSHAFVNEIRARPGLVAALEATAAGP